MTPEEREVVVELIKAVDSATKTLNDVCDKCIEQLQEKSKSQVDALESKQRELDTEHVDMFVAFTLEEKNKLQDTHYQFCLEMQGELLQARFVLERSLNVMFHNGGHTKITDILADINSVTSAVAALLHCNDVYYRLFSLYLNSHVSLFSPNDLISFLYTRGSAATADTSNMGIMSGDLLTKLRIFGGSR